MEILISEFPTYYTRTACPRTQLRGNAIEVESTQQTKSDKESSEKKTFIVALFQATQKQTPLISQ